MLMRQKVFSIHALLIGLLLMIGTTAYAEEGSVTLNSGTTSSGPISTASLFVAGDNLYVSATRATISASSNIKIKKLVINRGTLWTQQFKAGGFSVSPGTMSFSGAVLTVTDINSSTVYLERLADVNVGISSIVVYYDYTAVTGVTLSQTEASMIVGGETLTLTPTFTPSDASIKTVTWTTSDASVATVANGIVTAVAAGTATITATATNGTPDDTSDDKTATCTVTVSNPTVTANSDGAATPSYWSTYYNATKSFTADENTTVYKAALNGTSSVTLTEVAGREIPAGQAVILKSTTGTITLTPAATTSSDFTGNDLKGGTTVTSGNVAYTLSRGNAGTGAVGFYKFSGSLDGSKAHLEISTSAGTRSFIGFGDDNTTGIELPALADDEAAEWYSLDGRRLSGKPARKGIYVKDGQKYIIK